MKNHSKLSLKKAAFLTIALGGSQPLYSDCPPDAFYKLSITNKMESEAKCYLSRSDLVVRPDILTVSSKATDFFDSVCSSYPYKLSCNVDGNSTNTLNSQDSPSWGTSQGFTLDNTQLVALPTT